MGHPPLPLRCHGVRLATEDRHTGRVGIVAIGVQPEASSSMEAWG